MMKGNACDAKSSVLDFLGLMSAVPDLQNVMEGG